MLNQAIGSSRFCIAARKASCSNGLSVCLAAGRTRMEMAIRLPIHATVASMCSQKINPSAQKGIGGMDYGATVGTSVAGGSVGATVGTTTSVVGVGAISVGG